MRIKESAKLNEKGWEKGICNFVPGERCSKNSQVDCYNYSYCSSFS